MNRTPFLLVVALLATSLPLAEAQGTNHAPLVFTKNADFALSDAVSGGLGTSGSPYIIEGWNIQSTSGPALTIRDANSYVVIRNNAFDSTDVETVLLANAQNVRLEDNTVTGQTGIHTQSVSNIQIVGNHITAKRAWYDQFSNEARNAFTDNSATGTRLDEGALLSSSQKWTIQGNTVSSYTNGLHLRDGATANTIKTNHWTNNKLGVLADTNSGGNTLYDNRLQNDANAKEVGTFTNAWSIPPIAGPNIMGGPNIAGNSWSDYAGIDSDGDRIGDSNLPHGAQLRQGDMRPVFGPYQPPNVDLEVTPSAGGVPLDVRFVANVQGDAYITNWLWTFGDGFTSSSSGGVEHTYNVRGTYTARLDVEDSMGTRVTKTATIVVGDPQAPKITVKAIPTSGAAPLRVSFTATVTDDGRTDVAWDFGDGETAKGTSVEHTFQKKGAYTVIATATDNGGLKASANVRVTTTNAAPLIDLQVDRLNDAGIMYAAATLNATDPDGDIVGLDITHNAQAHNTTGIILEVPAGATGGLLRITGHATDDSGQQVEAARSLQGARSVESWMPTPTGSIRPEYSGGQAPRPITLHASGMGPESGTLSIDWGDGILQTQADPAPSPLESITLPDGVDPAVMQPWGPAGKHYAAPWGPTMSQIIDLDTGQTVGPYPEDSVAGILLVPDGETAWIVDRGGSPVRYTVTHVDADFNPLAPSRILDLPIPMESGGVMQNGHLVVFGGALYTDPAGAQKTVNSNVYDIDPATGHVTVKAGPNDATMVSPRVCRTPTGVLVVSGATYLVPNQPWSGGSGLPEHDHRLDGTYLATFNVVHYDGTTYTQPQARYAFGVSAACTSTGAALHAATLASGGRMGIHYSGSFQGRPEVATNDLLQPLGYVEGNTVTWIGATACTRNAGLSNACAANHARSQDTRIQERLELPIEHSYQSGGSKEIRVVAASYGGQNCQNAGCLTGPHVARIVYEGTFDVIGDNPHELRILTDKDAGQAPLEIVAQATMGNGAIQLANLEWTTSDDQEAQGNDPRFFFPTSGAYTIRVQATMPDGLVSIATKTIVATDDKLRSVKAEVFELNPGSFPAEVQLHYVPNGFGANQVTKTTWLLDNEIVANQQDSVIRIEIAGDHDVRLELQLADGAQVNTTTEFSVVDPNTRLRLTANIREGPVPLTVNLQATIDGEPWIAGWTFRDGEAAQGQSVTHTFRRSGSYTVHAVAADGNGTALESQIRITVLPGGFIKDLDRTCNTPCRITPAGGGDTCEWDFGDGGRSLECNPRHTYETSGTYVVILRVYDANGLVAQESAAVRVQGTDAKVVPGPELAVLALALLATALRRRNRH